MSCSLKSADLLLANTGGFLWDRQSYLLLVFIFPPIDYLVILIILFAQLSQNKQKWHVAAGQYQAQAYLWGTDLVTLYVVNFVPEEWLDCINLSVRIRFAIVGEGEERK